jgi:GST-like protein
MTQPIEIYGAKTGNCLRVAIALEEASIPYAVRRVDLASGEQRSERHLALNPAGKVPTIIDHSRGSSPLVLSQSNAILLYIAERYAGHLLPETEPFLRAIVLERFFYFVTDVIAPSHAGFFLHRNNESTGAELLNRHSLNALIAAERFLADTPFIAGKEFSLADVVAFTIVLASESQLDWTELPRLRQWFLTVQMRPAVERGLKAFDPPLGQ